MKKNFPKSLEAMTDDELNHLLKNKINLSGKQQYKVKSEIRLREKLKDVLAPVPPVKTIDSENLEAGLNKLDNKLQRIKDSERFRNIAYICSLIYFFARFISFANGFTQPIFDFLLDLVMIAVFIFTFLWIRRRVLLFSLFFYMIYWNIAIISNPMFHSADNAFNLLYIDKVGAIFNLLSLLGLLLGLTNKFKHRYFAKEIEHNQKLVVGVMLGISAVFQIIVRIA